MKTQVTDVETKLYNDAFDYRQFKNLEFIDNINERYAVGKIIGQGGFTVIRKAIHK